MARLEDVRVGVSVRGITPEGVAKIVTVEWSGDATIKVVYEDGDGAVKNRLVDRSEEPSLEVVTSGGPCLRTGLLVDTVVCCPHPNQQCP